MLNCWTSSSDISGDHADFHEGQGTVGAGQGRGMAWARHAMCELAFSLCLPAQMLSHAYDTSSLNLRGHHTTVLLMVNQQQMNTQFEVIPVHAMKAYVELEV